MTKGVLLFASNNPQVDYIKQAIYCAKRIKQFLNLPVAIATPNGDYLTNQFPFYKSYIDKIINIEATNSNQVRRFRDGVYSEKRLEWNNLSRADCYELTPFDQTIVMDTDYLICNSHLKTVFNTKEHIMLYKDYIDVGYNRTNTGLDMVSDKSIPMYWATVFYFDKSPMSQMFFNLVKHIKENWNFYRLTYQISQGNYRNDFAFSIAIHIINGFEKREWPKTLPGKMYLTVDYDVLYEAYDNTFKFLIDNTMSGNYSAASIKDCNIHIMNKFSLGRHIDREFENE